MTRHSAADRFVSEHDGILTRHCFSAGPHYDPARLGFGPLVAVDEHLVAPGAGFDWHAHRGVTILTWVLAGTLRHEDGVGPVESAPLDLTPGRLLVQATADGIRHRETNPAGEPLRFLQFTLLGADATGVSSVELPVGVAGVRLAVADGYRGPGPAFAIVLAGDSGSGDWFEIDGPDEVSSAGRLLVLDFSSSA